MRRLHLLACAAFVVLAGCSSPVEPAPEAFVAPLLFQGPSGLETEAETEAAGAVAAQQAAAAAAVAQAAADAAAQAAAAQAAADAEAAEAAEEQAAAEVAAGQATTAAPGDECIGYGCSPEQDAEINAAEAAANDDYGPGCDYQLCGSEESAYPPYSCDVAEDGTAVCEGELPPG